MSRGDAKRLNDIRRMCAAAADLTARGRGAADRDEALWFALERIIEIAGEAATQLSDECRGVYRDVPWRELMGVRVVLAHGYHRVDRDLLWASASTELPVIADALGPIEVAES